MFEFKKAMKGIKKEEGFECECCGAMEGQADAASSNCSPGCGPASSCCGPSDTACCGPAMSSCGSPMDGFCGEKAPEKDEKSAESDCKSSCSGK